MAQKTRHIVKACRRKKGSISPLERDHVWMGAVEKDVLLILYIIMMSITQVTSRGGIVSPGHSFNSGKHYTEAVRIKVIRIAWQHTEHYLIRKERKTCRQQNNSLGVPTSIKEKETHWPKEP